MRTLNALVAVLAVAVTGCAAPPTASSGPVYTPAEIGANFGDSVWRIEVDGCGIDAGGSSFVIDDDLLLTNQHVVAYDPTPTVFSRDGRRLSGEVIGMTEDPDLAVIRVEESLGEALVWREAAELTEGQVVVSLGYPEPLGNFSVAPGNLLSFEVVDGVRIAILSDEASDFGSSGGPLIDETGRVIGMVTEFAEGDGKQITGLSYAIEYLADAIEDITANPRTLTETCDGVNFGTSSDFDTLWSLCDGERYWACDVLYEISKIGSEYSGFGATCGDRVDTEEWCTDLYGSVYPEGYGDDDYLDVLWDLCEANAGDGPAACDELFGIAPPESVYEEFGLTCGGRFDAPDDYCVDLDY